MGNGGRATRSTTSCTKPFGSRVDDPESLTEATVALLAGVERLLDRSLGPYEARRFRHLAATAEPSEIMPLVHRLNGGIRARQARALATRTDISDLAWG